MHSALLHEHKNLQDDYSTLHGYVEVGTGCYNQNYQKAVAMKCCFSNWIMYFHKYVLVRLCRVGQHVTDFAQNLKNETSIAKT